MGIFRFQVTFKNMFRSSLRMSAFTCQLFELWANQSLEVQKESLEVQKSSSKVQKQCLEVQMSSS